MYDTTLYLPPLPGPMLYIGPTRAFLSTLQPIVRQDSWGGVCPTPLPLHCSPLYSPYATPIVYPTPPIACPFTSPCLSQGLPCTVVCYPSLPSRGNYGSATIDANSRVGLVPCGLVWRSICGTTQVLSTKL